MRIAVIGTGISGLASAWLLNQRHEVHVFEARDRVGGHTHTIKVDRGGRELALDTGFLVFNRVNYPNLSRLFDRLDVPAQETDMSFAVRCERCDLEYSGHNALSLFAQKRNLFRPGFYRMLVDISRFGSLGKRQLAEGTVSGTTLGEYLAEGDLGEEFATHYLVPMAAALWSSGTHVIDEFPAEYLLRFFDNHGLLQLKDRMQWLTVAGGSHTYVAALTRDLGERVYTNTPVRGVARISGGVRLFFANGASELFDRVVLATHADQALGILCDPSQDELELLGRWRYSRNDTWLHTDTSQLPRRRSAWGAWNYMLSNCKIPAQSVAASYYLNRLQRLEVDEDYVVTLNPNSPPAAERVIRRMEYSHPIYDLDSVSTQPELPRLNGPRSTFFAGAYFGHGFHEDGMNSALQVADAFGVSLS
jgi:predicted NAD/FAD-binding protein